MFRRVRRLVLWRVPRPVRRAGLPEVAEQLKAAPPGGLVVPATTTGASAALLGRTLSEKIALGARVGLGGAC